MPKFKNEYGVSKIIYTQKCRCSVQQILLRKTGMSLSSGL